MITPEKYKELVDSLGGSRPFDPTGSNFFIIFDHRIELYDLYTVNDKCEAPERLYMDREIAFSVRNELNLGLLKAYNERP